MIDGIRMQKKTGFQVRWLVLYLNVAGRFNRAFHKVTIEVWYISLVLLHR